MDTSAYNQHTGKATKKTGIPTKHRTGQDVLGVSWVLKTFFDICKQLS